MWIFKSSQLTKQWCIVPFVTAGFTVNRPQLIVVHTHAVCCNLLVLLITYTCTCKLFIPTNSDHALISLPHTWPVFCQVVELSFVRKIVWQYILTPRASPANFATFTWRTPRVYFAASLINCTYFFSLTYFRFLPKTREGGGGPLRIFEGDVIHEKAWANCGTIPVTIFITIDLRRYFWPLIFLSHLLLYNFLTILSNVKTVYDFVARVVW